MATTETTTAQPTLEEQLEQHRARLCGIELERKQLRDDRMKALGRHLVEDDAAVGKDVVRLDKELDRLTDAEHEAIASVAYLEIKLAQTTADERKAVRAETRAAVGRIAKKIATASRKLDEALDSVATQKPKLESLLLDLRRALISFNTTHPKTQVTIPRRLVEGKPLEWRLTEVLSYAPTALRGHRIVDDNNALLATLLRGMDEKLRQCDAADDSELSQQEAAALDT